MNVKNVLVSMVALGIFICGGSAAAKDGDSTTEGTIQAISTSAVQVGGNNYVLNSATEYQNSSGQAIAFSMFQVGRNIEIKWRAEGNARVARELELRSSGTATPTPAATRTPSATATPGGSDDSNRSDSSKSNKTELKRTLSKVIVTKAKAKVDYEGERKERRLKISVKLPKGTVPLVSSLAEAQALDFEAVITRGATVLATCGLDIDNTPEKTYFEYQLDVRVKKGKTRESKGSCDVDPATDGIQSGVPVLKKSDLVSIQEATAGAMFSGSLRK